MDLDFSQGAELLMDKVDGSLISSYAHRPAKIRLKSKTALESDQALAAMKYLSTNVPLYNFVEVMTGNDWTVNMEYTSPHFRIVVPHQEERLTVLNIRNNLTGEYMSYDAMRNLMKHWKCEQHLVVNYNVPSLSDFINSVPDMTTGVEGYVVKLVNGETFKIKTNSYIALHRLKDSIGSQKRLFEVVVNEAHDDAKAAFADDAFVLSQIADMEQKVKVIYLDIKHHVENFYNTNKELSRKDFAILAQKEVPKLYFGLVMSRYLDKEPNVKEFMLKRYKELGIKDDVKPVDIDE